MGINNLELTPELIAALYPESLMATGEPGRTGKNIPFTAPVPPVTDIYPFLGRNLKKICFLVHYPEVEFIPEEQLFFLIRILKACKYSLDDIALINTGKQHVEMADLRNQLDPRFIFLWGDVPGIFGKPDGFRDMTVTSFDGISVVPVLMAESMNNDSPVSIEMKQQLWIILKKLFSL